LEIEELLTTENAHKSKLKQLNLPSDIFAAEIHRAKLCALSAAKYVMHMGLTAVTRLESADPLLVSSSAREQVLKKSGSLCA